MLEHGIGRTPSDGRHLPARLHCGMASRRSVTVEMANGFSLYTMKAIISGRADEVIDLAKTNLWR